MKKLLALVLALVMTLSLCVTSNAAYKDAADVELDEAVDVLTAVGVFQGSDGKFDPKANLTREQAAKLVSYLQIGQKAADALVGGGKFADVAKDRWSAGYVDYCASTGVAAGVGAGKFDPAGSLTALQFGKMLLVCLGYDAASEGLTGTDWSINTSKLMTSADLLKGLSSVSAYTVITREQAAQMMLNALKAPMVEYANRATSISVNGADITFGGSTASYVSATVAQNASARNINRDKKLTNSDSYTVELGEKLFSKLVLNVDRDDFGRPANKWIYNNKEIGVYASIDPSFVYTAETKAKDVYSDLGKDVCTTTGANAYDWSFYNDGKPVVGVVPTKNSSTVWTENGEVTEVYIDDDKADVTVVTYANYLAKVTKVAEDDDGEYVKVAVLGKGAPKTTGTIHTTGFEKDDYVVVNFAYDDTYYVAEIADAATATGEVTLVRKWVDRDNDKSVGFSGEYLKLDDVKYTYSAFNAGDVDAENEYYPTLDTKYLLYLDANGYVIGFDNQEETEYNYLLVTASDVYMNKWEAEAILADGTTSTIVIKTVDGKKVTEAAAGVTAKNGLTDTAANGYKLYKYSMDGDKYVLTSLTAAYDTDEARTTTNKIENGVAYIRGTGAQNIIVDNDTVFVDVIDTDDIDVYTGFEKVPSYDNAKFWVVNDEKDTKIANLVFVYVGDKYDEDDTFFYVKTANDFTSYDKKKTVAEQVCYIDGVKDTLKIAYAERNAKITAAGLYKVLKTNTDGVATEIELVSKYTAAKVVLSKGTRSFYTDAYTGTAYAESQWVVNDETVYVVIDKIDDKVYEGSFTDVAKNPTSAKPGDELTYVDVIKDKDGVAQIVYITKALQPAWTLTVTAGEGTVISNVKVNNKAVSAPYTSVKLYEDDEVTYTVALAEGYENLKVNSTATNAGTYTVTASDDVTIAASATQIVVAPTMTINVFYQHQTTGNEVYPSETFTLTAAELTAHGPFTAPVIAGYAAVKNMETVPFVANTTKNVVFVYAPVEEVVLPTVSTANTISWTVQENSVHVVGADVKFTLLKNSNDPGTNAKIVSYTLNGDNAPDVPATRTGSNNNYSMEVTISGLNLYQPNAIVVTNVNAQN